MGGGFAEIVLKTGLITGADRCISDWNSPIFHLEKAVFFRFWGLFFFCFALLF